MRYSALGAPTFVQEGRLGYVVCGAGILVEALLERGASGDLADAPDASDQLANPPADEGSAIREITLLRLHAAGPGPR